jgi:exonuclease III
MKQMVQVDIYRTFYPKTKGYTFFSAIKKEIKDFLV